MTEPPMKRARRTDISTMWDTDEKRSRTSHTPEADSRHGSSRPEDSRTSTKDDQRRYRSRSRDRYPRKKDRSWSRDRDRDRDGGKRDSYKDGRGMRDRDRSTSRDRHYNRRGNAKSGRPDRSRSPRNGTRSRDYPARDSKADYRDSKRDGVRRPDQRRTNGASRGGTRDEEDIDPADMMSDIEDSDDIEAMMQKAVGFTKFRSTKNTKVPGNNIYGVRKEKKTEYRQYMNRVGGFNRPLSPGR
ncbi:conserved hypothetical protein [Talaromyces stipitatus ATCC 10500]|uniref:U4/U6.U5 small nuclear ribonucleoprotein 27kDa protein domain-containing protein n=1 Tax=Talaromyces stipitatus (strain ATCC 10500 / CBS 375.48 / QM 6759 / NRRL 1006) TaxID=441959 RepID=B8M6B3_TALSN|nr:uncharacterized protein TSTA_026030 [Talaromyces stipitatus ATCC 10500]EED19288.1 conserved hypothetical protein [Talaromyces stipitatus ATCC 10500]